jgi:PKD repeat protein
VKDFQIAVSNTTADLSSFTTVLTGTAQNNGTTQEFVFPGGTVDAKYVELLAIDNYGSPYYVAVSELQVVPVQTPGVLSYSSYRDASSRPEYAIDNNSQTGWVSADGQASGQFLKIALAEGEQLVDRVRLLPELADYAGAIKDFDVLVSTTTLDDSAFTLVLSATALNNGVQEFRFPAGPVEARYVELRAKTNYGGSHVSVASFEVVTVPSVGNLVSVPSAAGPNVARNESPAQEANGAALLASSPGFYSGYPPNALLNYFGNPWIATSPTGQFAKIALARGALYSLSGFRVGGRAGAPSQSVKDFEIWVSTTTPDDASFAKVFSGIVPLGSTEQVFTLPSPVQARYLKYVPLDNYGDPTYLASGRFDVFAAGAGGVVDSSGAVDLQNAAEVAFDGNASTVWLAPGVRNQWVKVLLAGGTHHRIYGVRIHPQANNGPKDFEVRVSTTTADDAAFATIARGTLNPTAPVQEVDFGNTLDAVYVEFVWDTGYGNFDIGVQDLEVLESANVGATVAGFSSAFYPPENALGPDPATGFWMTSSSQNEWFTLTLPGTDPLVIDHVALQGYGIYSPRNFQVQVSTTTTDPAAFSVAFSGTLRNDGNRQHFFFPQVPARHVRLMVLDGYGATQIFLQKFQVFSPQLGDARAQFSNRSLAPEGTITGYAWGFGDGGASALRDPAHAFGAPGVYEVVLTARGDTGLTSSHAMPYRVIGAPVADFTVYPASPAEGQNVVFLDTSTDPSGFALQRWDFGDGTQGTGPVGTHSYGSDGTYQVTLTVTDYFGETSTVVHPLTVLGGPPPTVSAGGDRAWVSGKPLTFVASIGWQGTDSQTCVWDLGDGTPPVTGCSVTHTYASPTDPAADPVDYTATLTVTDDDGATATSSTKTTIVPERLRLLALGPLTQPIAIDWSPVLQKLIVGEGWPFAGQLVVVGLDGSVSAPILANFGLGEKLCAISKGMGGFTAGDIFIASGQPGAIARVRVDGTGAVTEIENPWVTMTSAGSVSNAAVSFDTYGSFGFDLIVHWEDGTVYRVDSSKNYSLVGQVPDSPGGDGSPASTVAGAGFGPATGCVLTIGGGSTVFATCPDGSHPPIVDVGALTASEIEDIRYLPGPGAVFVTNYLGGVMTGDSRAFGVKMTGHVLLDTEAGGEILDLYWDPARATYKARHYARATNISHFESATFAPAQGLLSPATGTNAVGAIQTIGALATDVFGIPIPDLALTFTVAGANSASGTATTDNTGTATFSYVGAVAGVDSISAAFAGGVTNTVTRTWTLDTVAQSQAVSTNEGQAVTLTLVVADPTGRPLTYAIATPPQHGALSGTPPAVTYTPAAGYYGADSFTFKVNDGHADSNVAMVSITVTPSVVAQPQSLTTAQDTSAAVTLVAIDPSGESLTYSIVAQPQHGILWGTAPSLTYSPTPGYAGPDSFTFRTNNGHVDSNVATVSITVSGSTTGGGPPVAQAQSVSTTQNNPVTVLLVANDPNGFGLTYSVVAPPQHGTLAGMAPSLTYTPSSGFFGADSFTFKANNGHLDSNVATVSISVIGPPLAQSQAVSTNENAPIAITLGATDPNGFSLSYSVVAPPQHGTLSGTAPSLTYAPASGFFGADSFTFKASNGHLDSNVATISITVFGPPVAQSQAISTNQNTSIGMMLVATDPNGLGLTYSVVAPPQHGTLSGTAPSLTYTPDSGFFGTDSFTFKANNGHLDSNVAMVSITVIGPPVAQSQSVSASENSTTAITLIATDPNGFGLTYSVVTPPQHGTLSGTAPTLTYSSAAGFVGADSFTFKANNGHLDSNVATVSIAVNGPVCSTATAQPGSLWPPDHKMQPIQVSGVTHSSGLPVTLAATAIRQDEPTTGQGSGDQSPDATLTPLQVRAERSGEGDGRVYHIDFTASDATGGNCTGTVLVCVPHDQAGGSCVDQGPLYDSTKP